MKALFIRPPFRGKFREYSAPPLGIAYLAAVLEKEGHKVKIVDGQALNFKDEYIKTEIISFAPDIVGITALTVEILSAFKISEVIKKLNSNIFIIIGGPHATMVPHRTLEEAPSIDVVIRGEGECTILELVDFINGTKNLPDIRGITYRYNGRILDNEDRPPIKNIDPIPHPARHLLPMSYYKHSPKEHKQFPGTHIITSRGCPYRCSFCFKPIFGRSFRARSPENVIEEIKQLVDKYGVKDIFFRDDTFTLDRKRTCLICEKLIKEDLNITWSCLSRVDRLDIELLKLMKESGCWRILLGIETGNQDLLDLLKKDITLNQIKNTVRMCKKVGIQTDGFFMLGLPGESEEHAKRTIDFAKSLWLDYAQFYLTTPYPGTELYRIAFDYGILNMNEFEWKKFDQYGYDDPIYIPYGRTAKELKRTQKKAWIEFYMRPSYIIKNILKIKSFTDLKLRFEGFKSLISFQFIKD